MLLFERTRGVAAVAIAIAAVVIVFVGVGVAVAATIAPYRDITLMCFISFDQL